MGQVIELLWSCVLETDFSKAGGNEQSMILIIGLEVGKQMGKVKEGKSAQSKEICPWNRKGHASCCFSNPTLSTY